MNGRGMATGLWGGSLAGALVSIGLTYQASAAVAVRPSLADVGFLTAAITGHGADWVFYHHPFAGGAVAIVVLALIGILIGGAS